MSSIKLSDKHGGNPSLVICFWCGSKTGEIILTGRLSKDAESPKHMIADYKFCEKCDKLREGNATIIEVSTTPLERPTIQHNVWPTGRFWVVKKDFMGLDKHIDSVGMVTEEDARKAGLYGSEH